MKTVKKNVYYCDHCKKRSLSCGHMRTHEAHCTANPNRVCRLCGMRNIKAIIDAFRARFWLTENPWLDSEHMNNEPWPSHIVHWAGEPVTLNEVMEAVDGCPNCTLAILRQVGFNKHYFGFEAFQYKDKLAQWHKDNAPEPDYYGCM